MKVILKPLPGEYDPYTITCIKLLPDDGLIIQHLRSNTVVMKQFLVSLTPEQ